MKALRLLTVFAMAMLVSACAGRMVQVQVDAYADTPRNICKRYVIIPGVEGVKQIDLEFKEYSRRIAASINRAGFEYTDDTNSACLAVILSYGTSNPVYTPYSESHPVIGIVGGGTSSYSGTAYGSGGLTGMSGQITSQPTIGVTGYRQESGVRESFTRTVTVEAVNLVEFNQTSQIRPVWKVVASTEDKQGSLREIFPYLAKAIEGYAGKSDGRKVVVTAQQLKRQAKEEAARGLAPQ